MSVESLIVAREKFGRALEIYAPMGVGRASVFTMMSAVLTEFEAAVREDERALGRIAVAAAVPTHNEIGVTEAQAMAGSDADVVERLKTQVEQPESPSLADMGKKKRK